MLPPLFFPPRAVHVAYLLLSVWTALPARSAVATLPDVGGASLRARICSDLGEATAADVVDGPD
jgi:hypothetical protein